VPAFLENVLLVENKGKIIYLKVFAVFLAGMLRRCTSAERFFLGLSRRYCTDLGRKKIRDWQDIVIEGCG
jgi:hypothetical protein